MVTDNWLAAVIAVASIGQLGFVLAYATNPWWTTPFGRALFAKGVALFMVLSLGAAGLAWDWTYEREVKFVFYSVLAVVLWVQAAFSCHIRAEARRAQKPQTPGRFLETERV